MEDRSTSDKPFMKSPVSSHAEESREHELSSGSRQGEISRRTLQSQTQTVNTENSGWEKRGFFAGQTSRYTQTLIAEINRVARRPFNILITGETGTGKTHAAREIHRLSARSNKPFLELNCANLPEHLVESELFGFSKGAFTGADHHHKGLFEEADGGMLFLDEIGDISFPVQSKLLRAIDEKEIKRLGTNHYQYCDVQIIAATSRNLTKMIEAGHFREDLYCRLAVLTIETAPLRTRREDIPALIAFYLREAAQAISMSDQDSGTYRLDERAAALLYEYDYPGNIRSLRNIIYELTSYVEEGGLISIELVRFVIRKLNLSNFKGNVQNKWDALDSNRATDELNPSLPLWPSSSLVDAMAKPNEIILPAEVCILREGETLLQWNARAKRCIIEAIRRTTGGSNKEVARRLGLTEDSLRGHLRRAKRALTEPRHSE